MPRRPRLFIPDQPQHIVVRGHNREPILARHEDFQFLYKCLHSASAKNGLAIHAWVFMHNHIHLLATPSTVKSLPTTLQSVGRRYSQYFNRNHHRSGALWEGRYKSSLVDTDYYLLCCYRYIELNPVRAGIARAPEDHIYSSYHTNGLGNPDPMVSPHPCFSEFVGDVSESEKSDSDTTSVNRASYRELCQQMLDRKTLSEIRRGTEKGLGIGHPNFLIKVARLNGQ